MRQTSTVVFCAIDTVVPARGKVATGFDEFGAALEHAGIPAVWVTTRSRAELDARLRELGHRGPFIAEDGCGAYLPEGYFNLRPEKTLRLARFTCIPVAEVQPVAAEALESIQVETGIEAVSLRSLSARELVQNTGLPAREADLTRQRDFDELFFFAGAGEPEIARFREEARRRNLALRRRGVFWSLAAGANLGRCVKELRRLYDRALRPHPTAIAIAAQDESTELFAACDRGLVLTRRTSEEGRLTAERGVRIKAFSLADPESWVRVLAEVGHRA